MANARQRRKGKEMPSSEQLSKMLFNADAIQFSLEEQAETKKSSHRGKVITGDEIRYHVDGEHISVPKGMTYERIYEVIKRLEEEQNTKQEFLKLFDCRPYDGAYAAAQVLKEMFGITVGQPIPNPTGPPDLPKTITIKTGPGRGDTATVPWGALAIPSMDGTPKFFFHGAPHKKYGAVFAVKVESPKKHKAVIDELFDRIDSYVSENSIYRGKALAGVEDLEFIDLSGFDRKNFVFSDEVEDLLENGLFSTIRNADLLSAAGVPVKRSALLYGPYGTGKTSIGMMLAQTAERYGWTYILAQPGRDSAQDVITTAMLYQPAVVMLEDFDVESSTQDNRAMSQLLEALDGATTKGHRIITVATTNHIDKIHPGLLRPGRLDYVVEIGSLDVHGVEKLIKRVVGSDKLDSVVDYDFIFEQMDEFEPSFVRATVDRAKQWAINRTGGLDYVLTTDDLAGAARSLHAQQKLMQAANEIKTPPTLDTAFREITQSTIEDMRLVDSGGDQTYGISGMKRRDRTGNAVQNL
jgi:transitional endoplasmic reticulum ATPase